MNTSTAGFSLADIPGVIRRARRVADMSQRDLAVAAGLGASTVARAELGGEPLSLQVLLRILEATGMRVIVLGPDGEQITPMRADSFRDGGGRRFPAHLDARLPRWPRHLGAGMPRSRPIPTLYCERRNRRDEQRQRTGVVPADHPGMDDQQRLQEEKALAQRASYERMRAARPPEPPLVDCFCGPDCESYCVDVCDCQCEPAPGRPPNLIRRWPAD